MAKKSKTIYKQIIMWDIDFIKRIVFVLVFLSNFQMYAQGIERKEIKIDTLNQINLESFSDFPDEIDGCSCYFSSSQANLKNGMYIFVNDFASFAFVKIEGNLLRFELQNHNENSNIYIYNHDNDKMKVEITKRETISDEVSLVEGLITINTAKGSVKQKFVGECGC